MAYIKPIITDPVVVWKRLQNKFERKIEVAKEAAHMAFLNFEHSEIETADSLIERFEKAVQLCEQQGLPQSEDIQLRMLLARPSDRYSTLKTIFQHSAVKPGLEATFASMRDVDATYQSKHGGPFPGAAAFAEAVQVQAELLWAQRSNKEKKGGDADWKANMTCYNCHKKGHMSNDCPIQS